MRTNGGIKKCTDDSVSVAGYPNSHDAITAGELKTDNEQKKERKWSLYKQITESAEQESSWGHAR
jgi:hypothetical protein